jgi:hypothetical protein
MPQPTITASAPTGAVPPRSVAEAHRLACEVADVLGAMTFAERLRAYRSRVFSPHELALAAAWFPDEMPILHGDYEWLAFDLE